MKKEFTEEEMNTIEDLLDELAKANAEKDTKTAKKIRRQLRSMNYYISQGGMVDEKPTSGKGVKKDKTEEPKAKKEKKEEPKEDDEAEKIKKAKTPRDIFGADVSNWKSEFRRLSKKFHPDTENGNEEIMKIINKFWDQVNKSRR